MGIGRRLAQLFRIKANRILDQAEDPREVLDYSYERQLELLATVRRSLADVATSRRSVGIQLEQLATSSDRLQAQAARAVELGRDDLAREALIRCRAVQAQITSITAQRDTLQDEEDRLTATTERLQSRIEAFRTRKETVKAAFTAAEAQARVGEAVSGISAEMGDIDLAMHRAEDRTAQMRARAGALDELIASGALDDAAVPVDHDDIQAALDAVEGPVDVERELAALKTRAVTAGPQTEPPPATPRSE